MVDTAPARTDLWQVLAGRAVGAPLAPDDPHLWDRIATQLNPAKARPRLRAGIESVAHVTVRGQPYVMLRSPDRIASYVRLTPNEWDLAQQMDGSRSVAVLVGVLARATGKLAPDRVTRVVADLGANRMLEELPVDAFGCVRRVRARRGRLRRRLLDAARGRRMVLGDVDGAVGLLYRAGGRLLFTRAFAVLAALLALVGGALFLRTWASGGESLFLSSGSYAAGGLLLLGLNVVALLAHELGHALATKHAGRRVPAVGVLLYFGIPSAFVDTTDIWMASRKHRLIATAAGPASALTLAGTMQIVALVEPGLAPLAFKLGFAWYLNALFNLNPLMALDGYYLAMDALEIPNLRARGIAFLVRVVRTRRLRWQTLDREGRYVAAYGLAAALWTVVFAAVASRIWRDRLSGLVAGVWHTGIGGRLLVLAFFSGLFAPLLAGIGGALARRRRRQRALREATRGASARLDALRASRLGTLPPTVLDELAASASWQVVASGRTLAHAGAEPGSVLVLAEGVADGRRPGDAPATVRVRAVAGDVVGVDDVLAQRSSALGWRAGEDSRVLAIPAQRFRTAAGDALTPPGVDRLAAEAALDASPLAAVAPSARLELLGRMTPVDVPPAKAVTVRDPEHAVLVGAGVLAHDDGRESRAGAVVQAASADDPVRVTTRTRSTLWRLPGFGALGAGTVAATAGAPALGVHGAGGHPPVTPPPTDTPAGDDEADDRLWRRTQRLLALLLLIALLALGGAVADALPWSEVRGDRVLLVVARGRAVVTVDGDAATLRRGDRVTLGVGDGVQVRRRSSVHLLYAGGARQLLCGGSVARVLAVGRQRDDSRWLASGTLRLERGALLADTKQQSGAFAPLELVVSSEGVQVTATGDPARFGMTPRRVEVESGDVVVEGAAARHGSVDCRGLGGDDGADGAGPVASPSGAVPTANGASPTSAVTTGPGETPVPGGTPSSITAGPTATSAPRPTSTARPSPTPTPTRTPAPLPTTRPPTPSPTPSPDLAWACEPTSLEFQRGSGGRSSCTAKSANGYSGSLTFSCDNVPSGMSCSASPDRAALAPGQSVSAVFSLSADSTLRSGTYSVDAVVRSTDGLFVRRVTLRVTVT